MLQTMRNKAQSWIAKALVGFMALTFALWGLESLVPSKDSELVMSVDNQDIVRRDLLQAMERKRNYLMSRQGAGFNPDLLDERVLERITMDELVSGAVIKSKLNQFNMTASDTTLQQVIAETPEFQQNGSFDKGRFDQLLMSLGMTFTGFKDYLRNEVASSQLRAGLVSSAFATQQEIRHLDNLYNQTRTLSWAVLGRDSAKKFVKVTDENIDAYYKSSSDDFKTIEQVQVEYLLLDKAALRKTIDITEEEIKSFYDSRVAEMKDQSSKSAEISIILFDQEKNETTPADRADQVYGLLKNGADFASMAKQYSDDLTTASEGGTLGTVEPGFFGDKFDEAVAALEINSFSAPVKTEFGSVIIEKKQEAEFKMPDLASMRSELVDELTERAADLIYVEKVQQLADISFEAADLEQPMEALGLSIQTTDFFGRQGGKAITANPKFIAAAFSDDVLTAALNSDLVEISKEQAVVIRLKHHKMPEVKPLEVVKDEVRSLLESKAIDKLQLEEAGEILAALRDGKTGSTINSKFEIKWNEPQALARSDIGVEPQIIERGFKLPYPGDGKPVFAAQKLKNGDSVVIRLDKVDVRKSTLTDEQLKQLGVSIAMNNAETLFGELLNYWKSIAEIKHYGSADKT